MTIKEQFSLINEAIPVPLSHADTIASAEVWLCKQARPAQAQGLAEAALHFYLPVFAK